MATEKESKVHARAQRLPMYRNVSSRMSLGCRPKLLCRYAGTNQESYPRISLSSIETHKGLKL